MSLHVGSFGGGIVVDGSADSQRTDEVQIADALDIGAKGTLAVTTAPSDYITLVDALIGPDAYTRLWAILECTGFNFSKTVAVGEVPLAGGTTPYGFATFNREGEAASFASVTVFAAASARLPILTPMAQGAVVMGADFAGVFPILFPGVKEVLVRAYLINIGAREGVAPNLAPGLHVIVVIPPSTAPTAYQIGEFDSLGTGPRGLRGISVALGGEGGAAGTLGRQLYFRGIIAYNNHVFGWGYDATDERIATITAITSAAVGAGTPLVTTAAAHGYAIGDRVLFKGVVGMTEINGLYATVVTVPIATTFSLDIATNTFTAYASDGRAVVGNGDGPARVMFSNLGRPLKFGNDNIAATTTDRLFTDTDAIVLGDAGEIIRDAIRWAGKLIFGTDKGLHYISGYGRDSFVSDGATPIMRSYNVVGPKAMIEGPDKALYGVSDQGLWVLKVLGDGPLPIFQQLRDFAGRSNGYWDQIWTENTAVAAGSFVLYRSYTIVTVGTTNFVAIGAAASTIGVKFTATGVGSGTGTAVPSPDSYPGQTNQDLVWMAVDWDLQQVVIGIPWCSIANGYGYGTDTIIIKYHVQTGGFTRQQFTGVQYTAAGYFRAQAQQAAVKFLGTATVGAKTIQRYGYKATNNATPALPSTMPAVRFGPYAPFGPDGDGVVKRLYLTIAWDARGMPLTISGITAANPAVVTTSVAHGLATGDKVDIHGATCAMWQVIGGPYTITVLTATTFSIGVNSSAYTAFGGTAFVTLPLLFTWILKIDDSAVLGAVGSHPVATNQLAIRAVPPSTLQEGDLWVDTSNEDSNIGNHPPGAVVAASILLARGGYLLRLRHDTAVVDVTGATQANPCVITAPAHGFAVGQRVSFQGVNGMTQLNNSGAGPYTDYRVLSVADADHFAISVNSAAFGIYGSGGRVGLAWTLVPGLGGGGQSGGGSRVSIPLPVVRLPGARYTLDLVSTLLACRYQIEGFGMNPGEGEADA